MRPAILKKTLSFSIAHKLPVLIKGAPGIGKSDIVAQACIDSGCELIVSHPVVSDPTDYKGLPFPDANGGEAHFLPFGELNKLIKADKPTVFFLDDLGQAPMSVQAACMQLILARRINGHKVSDHVVFMAATNRRSDRAGVMGILEPVKSRFSAIVELEVSHEDWTEWAIDNNMPSELISFIQFMPNMLNDFKPTADIVNSPCPRTVAYVGKILNGNPPKEIRSHMITGAAGEGFAAELEAYLATYSKIPNWMEFLRTAATVEIPTGDPSMMYAYSGFVSGNVDTKTFAAAMKFVNRMPTEFQVLCIKNAIYRKKGLANTQEFIDWSRANMKSTLC